jgi:hypothetical protein
MNVFDGSDADVVFRLQVLCGSVNIVQMNEAEIGGSMAYD